MAGIVGTCCTFCLPIVSREAGGEASAVPQLHIVAVYKLHCFCGRFLIVGALNNVCWTGNAAVAVKTIDSELRHDPLSAAQQAGALPNSQPPTPSKTGR
jgi:hypothetical protein